METIVKNFAPGDFIVETYALFTGVDAEILRVNLVIEPLGYTFTPVTVYDLEKDFAALLSLPDGYQSGVKVTIEGGPGFLSNEFYEALMASSNFGSTVLQHGQVILLKRMEDFTQEVISHGGRFSVIDMDKSPMFRVSREMDDLIADLILHFRLLKTGDPEATLRFQIGKQSRKILSRKDGPRRKPFRVKKFEFSASELTLLQSRLTSGVATAIRANGLLQLALSNFQLSYEILDGQTRFVTLTTALESLFNHGRGEITHIVSRHVALVVSRNQKEFTLNYNRMKKLYAIRSAIVHGSTSKGDLAEQIIELEEYVRRAIIYCSALNPTDFPDKTALFDFLNAAGVSKG